MTDEQIIRLGLIELLIKVNRFDEGLARTVRKARANDNSDELITMIRRRLELDKQIADTLLNMPESMRKAMDKLRSQ